MRAENVRLNTRVTVNGQPGVLGSADAYDSDGNPTRTNQAASVWVDMESKIGSGWKPLSAVVETNRGQDA